MCGGGALGRSAADVIAREAANRAPGVRAAWAGRAARLALDGRAPRVEGVLPGVELGQLSLAIGNAGLILVVDAGIAAAGASNAAALVHALEWIAQHSRATVVALFPELHSTRRSTAFSSARVACRLRVTRRPTMLGRTARRASIPKPGSCPGAARRTR